MRLCTAEMTLFAASAVSSSVVPRRHKIKQNKMPLTSAAEPQHGIMPVFKVPRLYVPEKYIWVCGKEG